MFVIWTSLELNKYFNIHHAASISQNSIMKGKSKVYEVNKPYLSSITLDNGKTLQDDLSGTTSSPHRNEHGIHWAMAAVFIVGDMMGAGMISLPLALGNAGLGPGIAIILLASLFSGYTGIQLGDNWTMLQNRWTEYKQHCRRPYPEMAYRALGPWAKQAVSILLALSQFLIASVLLLMCAENLTTLLNVFFGWHLDFCVFIVALAAALWPLVMLQSPMDFWQLAIISAVSSSLAAGFIIAGSIHDSSACVPSRKLPSLSFTNFSLAYGTIVFAYGGHGAFPTIQHDMKKPQYFNRSVFWSYIFITIVYVAVSTTGLLVYGNSMVDTVIPSIQLKWISQTINVMITLHIFPTIVIVFSPLSQQVEEWFRAPNEFGVKRFLIRTLLLGCSTFLSLSVLKLGVFLDLVGATTITLMTMLLPSVFYLFLQASWKKRQDAIQSGLLSSNSPDDQIAKFSDIVYYTPKMILLFNVLSLTFGFVGGVSSAYSAIKELIGAHQVAPCYVRWFQEGFLGHSNGGSTHCCGEFSNVSYYHDISVCSVRP
ncbi:unnamed protein product [Caenorhabditis auriculariae]|uniref:Amino acid transporter transmembrane domain-containing protein n=1 Tax=Caenorhabditis auriculariae TaxID=2777116 RepID=A0A8S1GRT3_9PELO|nr:unnamed protein product [Caenorhabditis auriculariae]